MKITKISLKNIGPHKNLTIDFNDQIIAITGENGAGKSFLIEAVVACFYGSFPSRPGSIYDKITQGFEGEAKIIVQFYINGFTYEATRTMKRTEKSTSSSGNLYVFDGKAIKVAGPKVKDFEQGIVNLLGPQDVFLASVFSSQHNSGDICSAKPSERKEVFSQLLGLGRYDKLSDKAKEKAKDLEQEIESQEAMIIALKEQTLGEDNYIIELHNYSGQIVTSESNLASTRASIDLLEARIKTIDLEQEEVKQLIIQKHKLSEEIKKMEVDIEVDRAEYKKLKDLAGQVDAINKADLDFVKFYSEKEELIKQIHEADIENSKKKNEHQKNEQEVKRLKQSIENKKRELKLLESQSSLIDKTPNQECCKKCFLLESAINAKSKVSGCNEEIDKLKQELLVAESNIKTLELLDINELVNKRNTVICKLNEISLILDRRNSILEASGKLTALAESGKVKSKNLISKKDEFNRILVPDISDSSKLQNELIGLRSTEKRILSEINFLSSEVGARKERIKSIQEARVKISEIELGVVAIRLRIDDYREIEHAFGRSGIQPLIIEQARPELEGIATDLLLSATGGRMAVRFETQRELKSGDTVESLDIIITMDGNERKIEEFSGGEQKLLRSIIRLTLAVWQSRRGGSTLRTLFIDEIFDSLDADNSERILKLMESLQSQFDRILLISHDDNLLQEIPGRINLRRK